MLDVSPPFLPCIFRFKTSLGDLVARHKGLLSYKRRLALALKTKERERFSPSAQWRDLTNQETEQYRSRRNRDE
jgi:hypothetical protein